MNAFERRRSQIDRDRCAAAQCEAIVARASVYAQIFRVAANLVIAVSTIEGIYTNSVIQPVVSRVSIQGVVSPSAAEDVVTAAAIEDIFSIRPPDVLPKIQPRVVYGKTPQPP